MSIGMLPLEPLPIDGHRGVCSTCANPEHAPASKGVDHPFTMRVKAVGYVVACLPDDCPVCSEPLAKHEHLDIDLDCRVIECDRPDTWLFT